MKGWIVLNDLALVAVLIAWSVRRSGSPLPAIAYAWNPLVTLEYAGTAHHDPTGLLWMVVALALADERPLASAIAFSAAVMVKLAPLVALPLLLAKWPWRARLLAAGLLAAGLTWFLELASGPGSGLAAYAAHWRNNELAFHYLAVVLGDARARIGAAVIVGTLAVALALSRGGSVHGRAHSIARGRSCWGRWSIRGTSAGRSRSSRSRPRGPGCCCRRSRSSTTECSPRRPRAEVSTWRYHGDGSNTVRPWPWGSCLAGSGAGAPSVSRRMLESCIARLSSRVDGARALDDVRAISSHHRIQCSPGYDAAADWMIRAAREAGLEVEVEDVVADGRRSMLGCILPEGWACDRGRAQLVSGSSTEPLADFGAEPLSIVQRSTSAAGRFPLVGWRELPREGEHDSCDLRGRVVVTEGAVREAYRTAVRERGAAGIVSPSGAACFLRCGRANTTWTRSPTRRSGGRETSRGDGASS